MNLPAKNLSAHSFLFWEEFHGGDRSMKWFPDKERKFLPKCEEKMFLVELKEKTPFAGLIVVLPLPQLLFQGSTELWWESTRRRMKLGAKSNFLFYFNQQQQSRIPEHNLAGKIQYVTTLFVGADNCIICPKRSRSIMWLKTHNMAALTISSLHKANDSKSDFS